VSRRGPRFTVRVSGVSESFHPELLQGIEGLIARLLASAALSDHQEVGKGSQGVGPAISKVQHDEHEPAPDRKQAGNSPDSDPQLGP
jgi:hypothetical protein